ncbi:MAG: hypothetical protein ACRD0N_05535 [Acidimicrobiales bacterium]
MSASKVQAGTKPLIVPAAGPTVGWPVTLAEVQVPSAEPVRFHPSLRTAAELNGPPDEELATSA